MYEVLTGRKPFHGCGFRSAIQLANAVVKGRRPRLDEDDTGADLIRWCWSADPADRPSMSQVVKELSDASGLRNEVDPVRFGAYRDKIMRPWPPSW